MHSLLKTIKKKDKLTMSIDTLRKDKFNITIEPDKPRDIIRSETNGIVYQEIDDETIPIPDWKYNFPMVIDAVDFRKVKRLTTIDKTVNLSIQKTNFIEFTCGEMVLDATLSLGAMRDFYEEGECKYCGNDLEDCWCECSQCNEYNCDCWCECFQCGEYRVMCQCDVTFSSSYHSEVLAKLTKLPGLCTQMQFYPPTIPQSPLRIDINACQSGFTLGKIQIYIKDVKQIEYEASINGQQETVIQMVKAKPKAKKK
jgi:hypothetical protein